MQLKDNLQTDVAPNTLQTEFSHHHVRNSSVTGKLLACSKSTMRKRILCQQLLGTPFNV